MTERKHRRIKPLSRSSIRIIAVLVIFTLTIVSLNVIVSRIIVLNIIDLRKQELRRLVTLGLHSLEPIRYRFSEGDLTREEALDEARDVIRRMTYDDPDTRNYLFMSSYEGIMLVQPFEPEKEGTDQWSIQDNHGTYIIQALAAQAQKGPGYVEYYYPPPDRDESELKISYVVGLDELGCYLGTGLYISDIYILVSGIFLKKNIANISVIFLLALILIVLLRPLFVSYRLLQKQFGIIERDPDSLYNDYENPFQKNSEAWVLIRDFNHMVEELRNARRTTEEALHDKEVLLQEIHHRVKNNLQIISSLLNLQRMRLDDPEQQRVFQESALRIQSMSLIHETIYSSQLYNRVNMKEYIERVTDSIFQSAGPPDIAIQCDLRISEGELEIDKAILCGLILTELITNSLKHGFREAGDGILSLIYKQSDHDVVITIADNGHGVPADLLTREYESLGITLVKSLTEQLDGSITLDTSEGSRFSIIFPIA